MSSANATLTDMIRKILGFLPVGFWLIMLYFGGVDFMNPMNTGWHITDVPLNLWIWFGLAVLSGVLLCFDGMIPIGLIVGIIPYAYLTIMFLANGGSDVFPDVLVFPGIFFLFYIIYAVCYYTYNHELNKP